MVYAFLLPNRRQAGLRVGGRRSKPVRFAHFFFNLNFLVFACLDSAEVGMLHMFLANIQKYPKTLPNTYHLKPSLRGNGE
jgi:hypothetical protein